MREDPSGRELAFPIIAVGHSKNPPEMAFQVVTRRAETFSPVFQRIDGRAHQDDRHLAAHRPTPARVARRVGRERAGGPKSPGESLLGVFPHRPQAFDQRAAMSEQGIANDRKVRGFGAEQALVQISHLSRINGQQSQARVELTPGIVLDALEDIEERRQAEAGEVAMRR